MPTGDYFRSSLEKKKKKNNKKEKREKRGECHKETCFHPKFQKLMKITLSCFKLLL